MKLNKLVAGSAAAILLAATAFGVWASCGSSDCALVGETLVCAVQTPEGPRICFPGNTCSVNCN